MKKLLVILMAVLMSASIFAQKLPESKPTEKEYGVIQVVSKTVQEYASGIVKKRENASMKSGCVYPVVVIELPDYHDSNSAARKVSRAVAKFNDLHQISGMEAAEDGTVSIGYIYDDTLVNFAIINNIVVVAVIDAKKLK